MPAHGNELHHEAEVVLLIAREGRPATLSEAWDDVLGVSLGLDLTLRDVQQRLKQGGLPSEMAKSFEASAPIGQFVPTSDLPHAAFRPLATHPAEKCGLRRPARSSLRSGRNTRPCRRRSATRP